MLCLKFNIKSNKIKKLDFNSFYLITIFLKQRVIAKFFSFKYFTALCKFSF